MQRSPSGHVPRPASTAFILWRCSGLAISDLLPSAPAPARTGDSTAAPSHALSNTTLLQERRGAFAATMPGPPAPRTSAPGCWELQYRFDPKGQALETAYNKQGRGMALSACRWQRVLSGSLALPTATADIQPHALVRADSSGQQSRSAVASVWSSSGPRAASTPVGGWGRGGCCATRRRLHRWSHDERDAGFVGEY